MNRGLLGILTGLLAAAAPAFAGTATVTINTAALAGAKIKTAFDFTANTLNRNSATISNYSAPGSTMGLPETLGGLISGDLILQNNPASSTSIEFGSFFNSLAVVLNTTGNQITFSISYSELGPLGGAPPDAIAFYILDAAGQPLFATSDPLGTNALFTIELTGAVGGVVTAYTPAVKTGTSIQITIPANGLPPPTIVTPANGATLTSSAVEFSWTPAPGSDKFYDFRLINTLTGLLELRLGFIGSTTSQVYTVRSGQYRVEMRTCNATGCGSAATSTFTQQLGAIPGSPPSNLSCAIVNASGQNQLNCGWNALAGAHFYFVHVVQPTSGPGGGALTVAGTQIGANAVTLLIPNGASSVLVRGCTGDGCGPLSSPFSLNPNLGSPNVPIISEPFSGFVVDTGTSAPGVIFTWNRVAGDNGSNFKYRLYVQDFSRNAPAADVITANNFHGVYLNPATRYDVLIQTVPNSGPRVNGPANGFVARGKIPNAPSFVEPPIFSTSAPGLIRLGWTPIPDSSGNTGGRAYQYYLSGPTIRTGVVNDIFVNLTLPAGTYNGVVRACTTGTNCTASSEAGWGPFTGSATAEGGPTQFTIQ